MVIPADLPALVAPVAWMLGTWEGWGMYAAPATPGQEEPTEDSPVIEEICGDVVGEQMRLVTRVYAGVASEPIDPTWDAAKGLSAIKKGDLISEETVYVSVVDALLGERASSAELANILGRGAAKFLVAALPVYAMIRIGGI